MLDYRFRKYNKKRFVLIRQIRPFISKLIEILTLKLNKIQLQISFKKYKIYTIIKTNTKTNSCIRGALFVLEQKGYLKTVKTFSSLVKLYKYY